MSEKSPGQMFDSALTRSQQDINNLTLDEVQKDIATQEISVKLVDRERILKSLGLGLTDDELRLFNLYIRRSQLQNPQLWEEKIRPKF